MSERKQRPANQEVNGNAAVRQPHRIVHSFKPLLLSSRVAQCLYALFVSTYLVIDALVRAKQQTVLEVMSRKTMD